MLKTIYLKIKNLMFFYQGYIIKTDIEKILIIIFPAKRYSSTT